MPSIAEHGGRRRRFGRWVDLSTWTSLVRRPADARVRSFVALSVRPSTGGGAPRLLVQLRDNGRLGLPGGGVEQHDWPAGLPGGGAQWPAVPPGRMPTWRRVIGPGPPPLATTGDLSTRQHELAERHIQELTAMAATACSRAVGRELGEEHGLYRLIGPGARVAVFRVIQRFQHWSSMEFHVLWIVQREPQQPMPSLPDLLRSTAGARHVGSEVLGVMAMPLLHAGSDPPYRRNAPRNASNHCWEFPHWDYVQAWRNAETEVQAAAAAVAAGKQSKA